MMYMEFIISSVDIDHYIIVTFWAQTSTLINEQKVNKAEVIFEHYGIDGKLSHEDVFNLLVVMHATYY